ncbi:MAG: hypothetical protein ACK5VA_11970 [Pseudanabaena sp.]|jgi:hypothetical protein
MGSALHLSEKSNSDRPLNTLKHHDRLSKKINQRSPLSPIKITIATPQKTNSDRA